MVGRSLLIDTSTERGIVALFEEEQLVAQKVLPFGYQNSKYLLPEIDSLLKSQGWSIKELKLVASGVGPGSYTGMRIGAMVAKTLVYALKIPVIGVTTLEGFIPEKEGKFAAIIDAKIGGAYFLKGNFQAGQVQWEGAPSVEELPRIVEALEECSFLVAPVIEPLKSKMEKLTNQRWEWEEKDPNAHFIMKTAFEKYKRGEYRLDGSLPLLYLRKTQAEIEREQRT